MNKTLFAASTILLSAGVSIGIYFLMDHIYRKETTENTNLEDCAVEDIQEKDSTVIQTVTPVKVEKKKIFDKFKPMAKTVVAKKLLDEVLDNRDITITINLWKGDK